MQFFPILMQSFTSTAAGTQQLSSEWTNLIFMGFVLKNLKLFCKLGFRVLERYCFFYGVETYICNAVRSYSHAKLCFHRNRYPTTVKRVNELNFYGFRILKGFKTFLWVRVLGFRPVLFFLCCGNKYQFVPILMQSFTSTATGTQQLSSEETN